MTQRQIGPVGPDIDLDEEMVVLPDGARLTEAEAERIAERALARRRGRPPVSSASRTPSFTLRVPSDTRRALEGIARAQGRRLSDVGRDALAEYAAKHSR